MDKNKSRVCAFIALRLKWNIHIFWVEHFHFFFFSGRSMKCILHYSNFCIKLHKVKGSVWLISTCKNNVSSVENQIELFSLPLSKKNLSPFATRPYAQFHMRSAHFSSAVFFSSLRGNIWKGFLLVEAACIRYFCQHDMDDANEGFVLWKIPKRISPQDFL